VDESHEVAQQDPPIIDVRKGIGRDGDSPAVTVALSIEMQMRARDFLVVGVTMGGTAKI
jgi:hypothetical protein